MAAFPYIPTRLLSSPTSDNLIYIFRPGSSATELLALDANNTLFSTSFDDGTISAPLPFLNDAQGKSYTAAIDDDGNILVFAGACGDAGQGSSFWRFTPNTDGSHQNGTWKELNLVTEGMHDDGGLNGANYLASGIAFSSTANSTSEMFIFGGMCQNSSSVDIDHWQQEARYSNSMLTVEPTPTSSEPTPEYELGISPGRGPPIAEAGFSITALQPTFSSSEGSDESKSRNQNYVLLGGHTQQAFINMSQVALFSLPEQSWAFLPVASPSQDPKTDLATRDQASVDSRSGHTAVLTSDGKRVVVFGGWVGDVTNPAKPQLAVLELGEGYGGVGDWHWSLPSQTGPGLTVGTGMYGHGAAMLTGDVMMIMGGYQIPASSGSKWKRANFPTNDVTYFFNTTSNAWSTSYTRPKNAANHGTSSSSDADNNASRRRVGLGVGLTFGLLGIIAITLFYFWYKRRLKRQRSARNDEMRRLASASHHYQLSDQSNAGLRNNEISSVGDRLLTRHGPYPMNHGGPEAERTGLLFEIPSPTRGLRRSLHSRGTYQPTSRFDDGRRGAGFSTIHPIDERDEYDEDLPNGNSSRQHEMLQQEDYNILSNVPVLDPFQDPIGGSRTPSPQSPQDRELEIRNWVNDWTAADTLMHSQVGRLSPEKTDRTSSTLSDQSARSGLSSHSIQQSVGTISRSISQRSAALFSATPFRLNNDVTPADVQQNAPKPHSPEHHRAQSLTLYPSIQRTGTSETYATADTSIPYLQPEGEALLGDYPGSGEPSPTRSQSRARGWMGSVRRALTGTERSASTSPENNGSTSSSPTKRGYLDGGLPRRAASTGAMLWQKRQGARDWDAERNKRESDSSMAYGQDENDEEWDVESAVERRVVQVMFTVPKEKLRVVNRGPEGDGESMLSAEVKEANDDSDGHNKGKGKGKEKE